MTHYSNTNNPVDFPAPVKKDGRRTTTGWRKRQIAEMTQQDIIAGADIHAGDGGYEAVPLSELPPTRS